METQSVLWMEAVASNWKTIVSFFPTLTAESQPTLAHIPTFFSMYLFILCVYVFIHVCVYVFMHLCLYVFIHICVSMCLSIFVSMSLSMCVSMCLSMCVYLLRKRDFQVCNERFPVSLFGCIWLTNKVYKQPNDRKHTPGRRSVLFANFRLIANPHVFPV